MNTAIAPAATSQLEKVLIGGDLASLKPEERVMYYKAVCESVGLNPLTKPFEYISLNGKLTLYARRDATDQLRQLHKVSITIISREVMEDCYVVTARATTPNRQDESIGAVSIANTKGEARANAMMKAETKAKRRVTLSVCGLGMLDETEVDSIPGASVGITPTAGVLGSLTGKQQDVVIETANQCKAMLANDQTMDAYTLWQNSNFDAEEETAFWSLFNSKQRGILKKIQADERAQESGNISPAAHKRLEARIAELKLDREMVKTYVREVWHKEHFTDLTKEEYAALDGHLDSMALSAEPSGKGTVAPTGNALPSGIESTEQSDAAAPSSSGFISAEQLREIETLAEMKGLKGRLSAKLAASKIASVDKIPASKFDAILAWADQA